MVKHVPIDRLIDMIAEIFSVPPTMISVHPTQTSLSNTAAVVMGYNKNFIISTCSLGTNPVGSNTVGGASGSGATQTSKLYQGRVPRLRLFASRPRSKVFFLPLNKSINYLLFQTDAVSQAQLVQSVLLALQTLCTFEFDFRGPRLVFFIFFLP